MPWFLARASSPLRPVRQNRPGNCQGTGSHQEHTVPLPTSATSSCWWGCSQERGQGASLTLKTHVNSRKMVLTFHPLETCLCLWKTCPGAASSGGNSGQREAGRTWSLQGAGARTAASFPDVISMNMAQSQQENHCFKSELASEHASSRLVGLFLEMGLNLKFYI